MSDQGKLPNGEGSSGARASVVGGADPDLVRRLLYLLREAGPHRACELEPLLGRPTGEIEATMRGLVRVGTLERLAPIGSAAPRYRVKEGA